MRIVSLLPGATEMVCALGLAEQLVGISHECDFPAAISDRPRLSASRIADVLDAAEIDRQVRESATGVALNSIDSQALLQLQPDLIITQSLCDVCAIGADTVACAQGEAQISAQILSLDGRDFAGVLDDIEKIAALTGRSDFGRDLTATLHAEWAATKPAPSTPRVLYVEWSEPPYYGGHWVPEMIQHCGGYDVLGQSGQKSATFSWQQAAQAQPDVVVFACCGFDLQRNVQLAEGFYRSDQGQPFRQAALWAVDANSYFSRPGPRLVRGKQALSALLRDEPTVGICEPVYPAGLAQVHIH